MVLTIYRGTNLKDGENMLKGIFNNISWWTNDYETVEHYYEGCVLELTIRINENEKMTYICEDINIKNYTFGYSEMLYPEGAIWYSISSEYLNNYKLSIKEIAIEDIVNRRINN